MRWFRRPPCAICGHDQREHASTGKRACLHGWGHGRTFGGDVRCMCWRYDLNPQQATIDRFNDSQEAMRLYGANYR